MVDASGRWVITFNGEIYNYRALRTALQKEGCVFRTNSDTEVLIHVISTWGEAGLSKLRGMYAFALWDTLKRELWLARDRYGVKPLYVSERPGVIWFASQARALANSVPVDTQRDAAALVGFYLWGHVPEPFSWWAGIRMFPPGHVQRIRVGSAPSAPRAFASVQDAFTKQSAQPLSADDLRELVLDSVRHHMVADVPVGIFLSAGIDSNVVAELAADLGTKLSTITLAFDEYAGTPDDEAPLAEAAARILRSDHVTVRIGRCEFEELLSGFFESMDQPTIDGLNTYLISRAAASQGLKVALSGLGGDELFGGYPSFWQIPKLLKWGRRIPFPKPVGHAIEAVMRMMPVPGLPPKFAALLSHSGDIASGYLLRRALNVQNELDLLLDESWLKEGLERLSTTKAINQTVDALHAANVSVHAQIAAIESCWYMRNQLLRDTDWSSMAHGVEVRVPFVDATLLECLAPAIASDRPPSKLDLATCARRLSPAILGRDKTGFTTPVREWIGIAGRGARGLRGWAVEVHSQFRASSLLGMPA